jgi:NADP-dependent 3-hydroxy acid dehydrogenase YdfG
MSDERVMLITGASTGIGAATGASISTFAPFERMQRPV